MFLNLFFFMFSGLVPKTAGNFKPTGKFYLSKTNININIILQKVLCGRL